jgi:hypothetical protein
MQQVRGTLWLNSVVAQSVNAAMIANTVIGRMPVCESFSAFENDEDTITATNTVSTHFAAVLQSDFMQRIMSGAMKTSAVSVSGLDDHTIESVFGAHLRRMKMSDMPKKALSITSQFHRNLIAMQYAAVDQRSERMPS